MILSEKITGNARYETNKKIMVYFEVCAIRISNNKLRLDLTILLCPFWSYRSERFHKFFISIGFKFLFCTLIVLFFFELAILSSAVKPHLCADSLKFYNTFCTKKVIAKDFLPAMERYNKLSISIHATLINGMQRDRYILGIDHVKGIMFQ